MKSRIMNATQRPSQGWLALRGQGIPDLSNVKEMTKTGSSVSFPRSRPRKAGFLQEVTVD